MTWLTRLTERTEYVKELNRRNEAQAEMIDRDMELRRALREIGVWWSWSEHDGIKVATAYLPETPEPDTLPFCVKCGQGRKRGEKFTELTFKHDHCPSDDACEVVGATLPEQAQ